MTVDHKLAVVPATIAFQGVQLADGRIVAVEMERPGHGFAVVHTCDDQVEILSLHSTEDEAVSRARELGTYLEAMTGTYAAQAPGGRRGTMQ